MPLCGREDLSRPLDVDRQHVCPTWPVDAGGGLRTPRHNWLDQDPVGHGVDEDGRHFGDERAPRVLVQLEALFRVELDREAAVASLDPRLSALRGPSRDLVPALPEPVRIQAVILCAEW
jgi:hypothetical protein